MVKNMRMLIVVLYVAVAAIMDLITSRIQNGLILIGLLLGLCLQYAENGLIGILYAAAGAAVPILCLWVVFCVRALGAGDLKLLAVAGSFIGPIKVLDCILYTMAAGGVIALFLMISRRNLKERFRYLMCYIQKLIRTRRPEPYYEKLNKGNDFTMHFSVAILIGIVLCWEGVY